MDEVKRTCNSYGYCSYRVQGTCGWECTYKKYCDWQNPRDSRLKEKENEDMQELEP